MQAAKPARGRYAPSPTGELHLGNVSTALLAWLSARAQGGAFVMRIEDLDQARVRPGAAEQLLVELRWLGLDWEEGPDVGGSHAPYSQWQRLPLYDEAFERLKATQHVYPCFCSRKDIAAAASAPQIPGDEVRYPGMCRRLSAHEAQARIQAGRTHAWRFRVEPSALPEFEDLARGPFRWQDDEAPGDFVIRRADGVPAYQLAVVVDDAAMELTEVIRGDDLLPSTVRQLMLYRALEQDPPAFGHVPILVGADGVRLSKRHAGTSIRELRQAGFGAEQLVGRLAHRLGLAPRPERRSAHELVDGFSIRRVPAAPHGLGVDPAAWER